MKKIIAVLTLLAVTVLGTGRAEAAECVGIASPSTAIHMTSLYSVNGGYWETLWGTPYVGMRYVQDVYAYGVWIEGWVGSSLYLVPADRAVTSLYSC
jgi:hypothetical protein